MRTYARGLEALGDPTRREIVEMLGAGPMAVGEIARRMPVSRPAVSQHLRVLKEAGLVADRREGTRRLYGLRAEGLAEARAWLDRMWEEALTAFKRAAEAPGPARRARRGR